MNSNVLKIQVILSSDYVFNQAKFNLNTGSKQVKLNLANKHIFVLKKFKLVQKMSKINWSKIYKNVKIIISM